MRVCSTEHSKGAGGGGGRETGGRWGYKKRPVNLPEYYFVILLLFMLLLLLLLLLLLFFFMVHLLGNFLGNFEAGKDSKQECRNAKRRGKGKESKPQPRGTAGACVGGGGVGHGMVRVDCKQRKGCRVVFGGVYERGDVVVVVVVVSKRSKKKEKKKERCRSKLRALSS